MKLKYIVVLLMLCSVMLSGCAGEAEPEVVEDVVYIDMNISSYSAIDRYDAPDGYLFIVAETYIRNNSTALIDTDPDHWKISADGVEYSAHVATYNDVVSHQTVTLRPDAEFVTEFVYLVNIEQFGSADDFQIGYTGQHRPTIELIDYF